MLSTLLRCPQLLTFESEPVSPPLHCLGQTIAGVYAGDPSKLSMKAAFGRVWRLEDIGGSIIGGSLALLKQRQANPPPPRDE